MIKEIREKSEMMRFGRRVQEECHYLYKSRGDLKISVTDLGEEWQANGSQSQGTLVQVRETRFSNQYSSLALGVGLHSTI